jgi:hypothetical protein
MDASVPAARAPSESGSRPRRPARRSAGPQDPRGRPPRTPPRRRHEHRPEEPASAPPRAGGDPGQASPAAADLPPRRISSWREEALIAFGRALPVALAAVVLTFAIVWLCLAMGARVHRGDALLGATLLAIGIGAGAAAAGMLRRQQRRGDHRR